jgi:hypothetical protein
VVIVRFNFVDFVLTVNEELSSVTPLFPLNHLYNNLTLSSQQNQSIPPFLQMINNQLSTCQIDLIYHILNSSIDHIFLVEDDIIFEVELEGKWQSQWLACLRVNHVIIVKHIAPISNGLGVILNDPIAAGTESITGDLGS